MFIQLGTNIYKQPNYELNTTKDFSFIIILLKP